MWIELIYVNFNYILLYSVFCFVFLLILCFVQVLFVVLCFVTSLVFFL